MEKRGVVEHRIATGPDTALIVYCATCARTIAEFDSTIIGMHGLAMMTACNHWGSYRENHLVVVTSMKERRIQALYDDTSFDEFCDND